VVKRGERWLILTQYYAPELGAPQIRLRAVVQELRRHGLDIEVLTGMPNYPAGFIFADYRGRWRMRETIDAVPIRRTWLYAATGRSARIRLANYLSFTATALVAAMFGPKPDRMFVESQPLTLGLVAVLMKWLRGVPYIYNVPDLQVDVARELGFMRNARMLSIMTRVENLFLRQSWKVSTVTERFIEHFESRGVTRSQISFLPNGADTDFLRPLPPDEALLERWNLDGMKTFVYIGTHAYYHGLETVIEAAALLRHREDIAFLLIGDGPEREPMKELARQRQLNDIVFGSSSYDEMARCYSIAYASIAVLKDIEVARKMRPSKVFSALSCAVPVVFSGAGETTELLGIELGSPCRLRIRAASLGLLRILSTTPSAVTTWGRAGRELTERQFSWRVIVQRWLDEIGVAGGEAEAMDRQSQLGGFSTP
jgi:colanic acid biosynthesis glycosyl transferase WcaI